MSELGRAVEEASDPPIRAVFVYNSNPVATAPNQARVAQALARESVFLVVHEQVWTDTCALGDVILPATTFLEHTDLCRSYSGYALQWTDPVIAPLGEARPNHRLFADLARAMGFEESEFSEGEESIAESMVKGVGELRRSRYRALPRPIQFGDVFPARGYVDLAAPPGPPIFRPPPVDADRSLILISPATDKAITSQLYELEPEKHARVSIAPVEAEGRQLRDGDQVRLRNSFGEVLVRLAISDNLCPGVVSLPKGLWRRSTLNGWTANALAPDHVDATGGGACYNDARVDIEKA
jgi:anaerobic selenocysteine-containing dehydrogenase